MTRRPPPSKGRSPAGKPAPVAAARRRRAGSPTWLGLPIGCSLCRGGPAIGLTWHLLLDGGRSPAQCFLPEAQPDCHRDSAQPNEITPHQPILVLRVGQSHCPHCQSLMQTFSSPLKRRQIALCQRRSRSVGTRRRPRQSEQRRLSVTSRGDASKQRPDFQRGRTVLSGTGSQ